MAISSYERWTLGGVSKAFFSGAGLYTHSGLSIMGTSTESSSMLSDEGARRRFEFVVVVSMKQVGIPVRVERTKDRGVPGED